MFISLIKINNLKFKSCGTLLLQHETNDQNCHFCNILDIPVAHTVTIVFIRLTAYDFSGYHMVAFYYMITELTGVDYN